MKSSPRGKRSKLHCLEVELVKTVFGAAAAAAGAVEAGREQQLCVAERPIGEGKRLDAGEERQEEQRRLTEEWCSHRREGHNKRINRGTVGSSRQKREIKQGEQRGKEAGAAEMQDEKEWWEMPREALQEAIVRLNDNSKVSFCFVNTVALAKQSWRY